MLTDKRIREIWENYNPLFGIESFARSIEAEVQENCAKICDELAELNRTSPTDSMWEQGECAAAIRAQKKQDQ